METDDKVKAQNVLPALEFCKSQQQWLGSYNTSPPKLLCTVPSDRRWNFELFSKLPVLKLNILAK